MTQTTVTSSTRTSYLMLGAGMLLVFTYLLLRSLGKYPAVFADELIYSSFARLVPLREATIPSYLYFALYRSTSVCGPDFLDCARALNALLFVAAAPFIYLITRRLASPAAAAAVALMSLLLPVNSYTAYFMPEGMYFLAFFVLTWLALTRGALHRLAHALACGALLGAMTLIKVHALFLIPALCLFAMYSCWAGRGEGPWMQRAAAAACTIAAGAMSVRYGLGYLMGGPGALHLFGTFYGGHAANSATRPLLSYLAPAWINGRGHLLALALLFGMPLAVTIGGLAAAAKARRGADPATAAQLYTLLMGGAALGMTVMYTASISETATNEVLRLHLRYYDFAFPLLLIVTAGALQEARQLSLLNWVLALLLASASMLAVYLLPGYAMSLIDGPDIAALFLVYKVTPGLLSSIHVPDLAAPFLINNLAPGLALLQVAALVLWALGKPGAARLYLFAFVPVLLLGQNDAVHYLLTHVAKPTAFDSAGLYVRDRIPEADRKDVVMAGSGLALLMRAKFHADEPALSLLEMADGAPFDMDNFPVHRKWLVVIGKHALPPELAPSYANAQFSVVRVQAAHRKIDAAQFSNPGASGMIAELDGVDKVEPWGRWSNGARVAIRFRRPLPARLNLLLKGQSYGPNGQQDYVLRVGAAERRFRIGNAPAEVFLRLDTDGLQDTVTIDIPHPVSPHELEGSVDQRKLGLGLISIEIGERP